MTIILFIHFPTDSHLGATIKGEAMKTLVTNLFVHMCASVELLGHGVWVFSILEDTSKCSSQVSIPIYTPSSRVAVPLHSFPTLYYQINIYLDLKNNAVSMHEKHLDI